ncbi:MAG: hypothetical protein QOI51_1412 [Nocardioidaceae bacterium]|nr:hypothetical protein [Nocardioidaceae bacterium]
MKMLAPKFALLPLVTVVAALGVSAMPSQASTTHSVSTAATSRFAYQGDAYGTRVNLGNVVTSAPSAPVVLPCATTAGAHLTNTVTDVTLPPVLSTGTIDTTADTLVSPVKTVTTANVQNLNVLTGLVTAAAVRSASATYHISSGFHTSARGTSFTSLSVAGIPITGTVAKNTRINLTGLGYVVLNEQTSKVGTRSASLTVNAVHVVIDQTNLLNIPVGTNVVVAHATSALRGPVAGTLDGFAYGTRAQLGHVVSSGPSFRVILPCLGTNGHLKVHDGVGVSLPGVLVTGAVHNTAEGRIDGSTASGETTSTVDSANVVSELVQATVIRADTHAATDGTTFTFSDAGSSFGTLSVAGFSQINANVAPNTKLRIVGVGTLWLHRVIHLPNSIEVRMIELVVKHANTLGLPVGSDIRVAVSHASAH